MSTLQRATALAERLGHRTRWYSRIAAGRGRRATRLALARAHLPIRPEILVFDCASGEDASGLFSEVAAAIGCLAEVDAHPELYAGMRVDFQDHGLYYEPARGTNWWSYFFEPLDLGTPASPVRLVPDWEHDAFADAIERGYPRADAARLVRAHVRVKDALVQDADAYWRESVGDAPAVAVHYRGTDKHEEAPRVPFEQVVDAVRAAAQPLATGWKLFLATDEQACVDHLARAFPGRVAARPIRRSTDGRPLHKAHGGYQGGCDAVIDCVLLSRGTRFIRTASNLGLVASFFNPDLPVTVL